MSRLLPKKRAGGASRFPGRKGLAAFQSTGRKTVTRRMAAFRLLPGAFIYLAVFFFSMIFTQALRSPISAMLFVFVMLLPGASLLYLLLIRAALRVQTGDSVCIGQKNRPLSLSVRISNRSPLPIPAADVLLTLPDDNHIRCVSRLLPLSLTPLGSCALLENPVFRYRGEYSIRVDAVYVSDLFRFFRIRKRIDTDITVLILPALRQEITPSLPASETAEGQQLQPGRDRSAEVYGVRAYIPGDRLKDVHWKLSSKTPELLVREFSGQEENAVCILADYSSAKGSGSAKELPDDLDEYTADCVSDAVFTLAAKAQQSGIRYSVLRFGGRGGEEVCVFTPDSADDETALAKELARAKTVPSGRCVFDLAAHIGPARYTAALFVTGKPDSDAGIRMLSLLQSRFDSPRSAVRVFYADPACHAETPKQKKLLAEQSRRFRDRLSAAGIALTDIPAQGADKSAD